MSGIYHRDGWLVISQGKPVSRLMVTREEARHEARRLRSHQIVGAAVRRARVITVWNPRGGRVTVTPPPPAAARRAADVSETP